VRLEEETERRLAIHDAKGKLITVIDQCPEQGRYHLLNYRLPLDPALSPEDEAWAIRLLCQHQLR
jgi:hypothetical protein